MPTEAINMPWSFYRPLITIMIFKNQSNQTVSIQLIRRWEESKTVKVSNLKPEKTTTDLCGNYCNGFNNEPKLIQYSIFGNQAKRHISPGCQLVDVTMNSPSPNDFLLRCFSPPQTKYFNSPKFSLPINLLYYSPQ